MKPHIHLLVIDPQNDFCDLPEASRPLDPISGARAAPALPVPGAHADMQRLSALVAAAGATFDEITVTLDSHRAVDIAHPAFWQRADGSAVAPFTTLSAEQLRRGDFRPRAPDALLRALAYVEALEANGRYQLMVWPLHCEIGSWGHNVHAELQAACRAWEVQTLRTVGFVGKGQNPWTEHYSALQAEVPDPVDPGTGMNQALIDKLARADLIVVAGEAGSHCVKASVEHLVDQLPPGKLVLLTDCMSAVAGFEALQTQFLEAMRERGVRLSRSTELLTHLLNTQTA